MSKQSGFTEIPMTPLTGPLDTRSRPADLLVGSMRYKLNFSVNRTGALCQRSGHAALSFGQRSDSEDAVNNWDFHRQGADRELVTCLHESIAQDKTRRLFAGTQSRFSVLDNDTSEWTHVASGIGSAGKRFKAATLKDRVYFTNNHDDPRSHLFGSGTSEGIAELQGHQVTKARIVLAFAGVIVWMNLEMEGEEQSARVLWSDYQDGLSYEFFSDEETSGFQDLEYGDEILNAIELYNAVYIFTTRSIWRMTVSTSLGLGSPVFSFQKIYTETKNKTACLVYPNTLVSTGKELYWFGRDSIWTYNPYIIAPEAPDWLLRGCGHVFSADNADRLERRCCESPVAEYYPEARELWFSYPLASSVEEPTCVNNRTLVINHEFRTADIVDHGYGAFVNFGAQEEEGQPCVVAPSFIGSSGSDYCLKSIGGVFYRERVELIGDTIETDIPDDAYTVTQDGYYRRIVGQCPFGYPDREKILNGLIIQNDTVIQDTPNLLTLRIGNAQTVSDPMAPEGRCAVQWHTQESRDLDCPNPETMDALRDENMRPDEYMGWEAGSLYEIGRLLYFDIRITDPNGNAPVGSDSAWSALVFSVATAA